jgi:hypothetical protein
LLPVLTTYLRPGAARLEWTGRAYSPDRVARAGCEAEHPDGEGGRYRPWRQHVSDREPG